jgi:hypothetical protein
MMPGSKGHPWLMGLFLFAFMVGLVLKGDHPRTSAREPADDSFVKSIRPILKTYCLDCHSTKAKKGSLDLERFASTADLRQDLKLWQGLIEQVETGEMPPRNKPQPTADEKRQLLTWIRAFLDQEARSRTGDPGHVPLRRLSNAEYDATIRDLTGVDLRPTREFPADGAAGEGFTNAAEALTEISPALFTKYLNAAKDIADHAVLVPDGIRFSPGKTRRDWTDESTARLRSFYTAVATPEGRLPIAPYLLATIRHRDRLMAGQTTIAQIASREKLNAKYLNILWQSLTDKTPSIPLQSIRERWRTAKENDAPAIATEIAAWQNVLWNTGNVGNYIRTVANQYVESPSRQLPSDLTVTASMPFRLVVKPTPGQSEIVVTLATRDLLPAESGSRVVWQRPRFESAGQPPLLLKNYRQAGDAFNVDYRTIFANASQYLGAAAEAARDRKASIETLAHARGLDPVFLKRWVELLALDQGRVARPVPAVALDRLDEKFEKANGKAWINGWRNKGQELPIALSNSSDKVEMIPGTAASHQVVVHPTPTEFVAATWTSPVAGTFQISARIAHAHPACGNGVSWWLEHRHERSASVFAEGQVKLGGKASPTMQTLTVAKGDMILLAVDANNRDHTCDLTQIDLTITSLEQPARSWDLGKQVADSILDGNPHSDAFGNRDIWSFVKGPTRSVNTSAAVIPDDSLMARWRNAVIDPARKAEAEKLASEVQSLLSGPRPQQEKRPDRLLYDNLVSPAGVLFPGVNLTKLGKPLPQADRFGWPLERFGGSVDGDSVAVAANSVTELRLPAALFVGREFVVEGRLDKPDGNRVVQFQVTTDPAQSSWQANTTFVAESNGSGHQQLLTGIAKFRRVFPLFLCYPNVIPTDEVVSLKMFHREDEPLIQLFLDDRQTNHLNRLWSEHRYISRQAVAENDYLPQFIGYTTQDAPKGVVDFFEGQRTAFQRRADQFQKEYQEAIPRQLDALVEFAAKAYRRPLRDKERTDLHSLYQSIRTKGADHEEAFRGVLARILVSPAFLFRIETPPPGKPAAPVNDWELATRLSYFLWSSPPDEELRKLAAASRLRDPQVLSAQVTRMIQDPRTRSLAIEFGTQWIHVRGFDELKEKNERLFPGFDTALRQAMYEESILLFLDLFQADRPVTNLLDADYTFLNEVLAKHYGIPGVSGPHWRRVDGVKKYGRGGVLGLASVQTKQAGASRTSPILRGNWVVETLLGEKLPRPPANVPQLPEVEGADKLTMRQLVELHTKTPECAVCHVRIDPFGFALEKYDPIGRLRDKEITGLMVDAKAKLRDGTEFDGLDGLRNYLLTKKKDVVVRLFCKRLLGYALGRATVLSDTALLDEMVAELTKHDGKVSAAVQTIVKSPQFRMIRGSEFEN